MDTFRRLRSVGLTFTLTECEHCIIRALRTTNIVCAYKKQFVVYYDLRTVAISSVKMRMFSMEGYNSRTVFKYSVSQISIERIFLDKTIMTLTTAVGKKATELAEHLASGQQVV